MNKFSFKRLKNKFPFLFNRKYRKNRLFLKKIFIFKSLIKEELTILCNVAQEQTYQPNEFIIKEGELGNYFYIIKKGAVKVFTTNAHKEEIILAKLTKYAYFGEQALLRDAPVRRNATVEATTIVTVLKISHAHLQKSLNTNFKDVLRQIGEWQLSQKDIKKQFAFMQFIPDDLLEKLKGKIVDFSDGHIIFSQGDEPNFVYFILFGTVLIHILQENKTPQTVELNAGQLFGELGILQKIPRAGTAITKNNVKLLTIPAVLFSEMYYSIPELRRSLEARQQLYKISDRGQITIIDSLLLGMPAVSVEYHLNDGRVVNAARAFDQMVFAMKDANCAPDKTLVFQQGESIKREIGLSGDKIVSILVIRQWHELGFVCGLLLDNIPLKEWQKKLFENTGFIGQETLSSQNEMICYCMNITREQIKNHISAGNTDLKKLLHVSNAGQVCGECQPKIKELLGMINWAFVEVREVLSLTPAVHLYRLAPQDAEILHYNAGQYIILSAFINGKWVLRSYTLTSIDGESDYYEIAIKREELGYLSSWIFENENKRPLLKVSQPQGTFTVNLKKKVPIVFFAAGIGITPSYSMVHSLHKKNYARPYFIHYSAHQVGDLIFIDDFNKIAQDDRNFSFKTRITSMEGRLTKADLAAIINSFKNAIFYICGPESYRNFIIDYLKSQGISSKKIKIEIFTI